MKKEYLLLWNLLMPFETNVVTSDEAKYLYSFDMNKQDDVITLFDLYIKKYFLELTEEKKNEILLAITKILAGGEGSIDYFFDYEFGFASQEPINRQVFLELVKEILNLYLGER